MSQKKQHRVNVNKEESAEQTKSNEVIENEEKKSRFKTKYVKKTVLQIRRSQSNKGIIKKVAIYKKIQVEMEEEDSDDMFGDFSLDKMVNDRRTTTSEQITLQKQAPSPIQNKFEKELTFQEYPQQSISPEFRRQLILKQYRICNQYRSQRSIFALGVHLFDLYIQKAKISGDNGIFIAVSCVILAMKLENPQQYPRICYTDQLPKRKFVQAELEIFRRLEYKIQYSTYFTHLHDLIRSWDTFVKESGKISLNFAFNHPSIPEKTLAFILPLNDKLECISLISYFKTSDIKNICLNLFYLEIYFRSINFKKSQGWEKTLPQEISKAYRRNCFLEVFEKFLHFQKNRFQEREICQAKLSLNVGLFLAPFMKVQSSDFAIHPGLSLNENISKMRHNPNLLWYSTEILREMNDTRIK